MEVAMTRTAIPLTLSTLPALVLVTAVAANPALAQPDAGQQMEYLKQEKWIASQEQKTIKRLTASISRNGLWLSIGVYGQGGGTVLPMALVAGLRRRRKVNPVYSIRPCHRRLDRAIQ
jgi:hypothetical protein